MPKMNGFELYKELEKIDNGIKVVLYTAPAFEVYYEALREVFPVSRGRVLCSKTYRNGKFGKEDKK